MLRCVLHLGAAALSHVANSRLAKGQLPRLRAGACHLTPKSAPRHPRSSRCWTRSSRFEPPTPARTAVAALAAEEKRLHDPHFASDGAKGTLHARKHVHASSERVADILLCLPPLRASCARPSNRIRYVDATPFHWVAPCSRVPCVRLLENDAEHTRILGVCSRTLDDAH